MAKQSNDKWDLNFIERSPLFFPISSAVAKLKKSEQHWPSLHDYQLLLDQLNPSLISGSGAHLHFVPQAHKPKSWRDDYEPRIYLKGEIQTRLENWHDFFQVLMWYTFPKTKSTLNALHFTAIKNRIENNSNDNKRTPLENALTQYDECGAIIVSSDESLLTLINKFKWKELFWERREQIIPCLQCFIFGHANYEKALNPYIGLTAHAVLLKVNHNFFELPLDKQLTAIDNEVAKNFESIKYTTPRDFSPFPLLGLPNWYKDNEQESFYDNQAYFRPGRSR